jgi:hypothetical protein
MEVTGWCDGEFGEDAVQTVGVGGVTRIRLVPHP